MHDDVAVRRSGLLHRMLAVLAASAMLVTGLVAAGAAPVAQAAAAGPKDTIAVLFSYTWNRIAQECESTLGPAGYGYVQTSPPQEHVQGPQWWTYYQPVSYRLESRMGTETEFRSMVQRCNEAGVGVIVDAVINHMSGQSDGGTGWAGSQFQHYDYPGLYSSNDFHSCRRDIADYQNRWEVQECNLVNLSDLDTSAPYVQQKLADYLNGLVDMGVSGFRFDAVKHIAAADMRGIWNRVKNKDRLYVVQEVIRADEPIQPEEYTSNGDVHEFGYARKLKEAFGGSRIDWLISGAGIGGTWEGFLPQDKAAVFVDNHDTERNGETLSYKDGKTYDLAQAFTLAWPYGSPSIQSGYAFDDKDQGPAVDGEGRVIDPAPGQNGWTFKHAQNDIQNMVGFRVATYGTDVVNKWSSSDGRMLAFGRGDKGFIAINNGGSQVRQTFTTSLPDGTYYNVITAKRIGSSWSGETIAVSGGKFTATVDGKTAIALHVGASVTECTDTSAPTAPAGVQASIEGQTVTVSWAPSTDDCAVIGYEIERTGGDNGAITKTTAEPGLVDDELEPGTEYSYTIRAKDAAGRTSAASEEVSITTPEEPQSAVTSVYYEAASGWTSAYMHYRVGSGAWTTAPGTAMTAVPGLPGWFSLSVEAPAGEVITAAFNNGSGTWDNNAGQDYSISSGGDMSVSGGAVTAGAPEEPVIPDPLAGALEVFYRPASGWSSVYAHYQLGSGSWTTVPGVAMVAVSSCDDGDGWYRLSIDTGSAESVRAAFNNGSGTWDNNGGRDYEFTTAEAAVSGGVVSAIDPCGVVAEPVVPVVPTGLAAQAAGTSSIELSWQPVADATDYTVAFAAEEDGAVTYTAVRSGTSYTASGLLPDTSYWFKVRAENTAGSSVFSTPVFATTDDDRVVEPTPTPTPTDPEGADPAGSVAGATTGTPLGGDPREDSIYFMMTARWNDGDSSNNMGGSQHVKSGNAANDDPMFRGDFQGIIDKLDYIKGLGFSAIWITPVVTNRSDYDFHGYHGWDFQRVDPRLESDGATYQQLIDAAHAEGIKIYQDVVYNHTSRWGEKNLFTPTVYGTRDAEWSWYYDEPVPGKAYNPAQPDADGSTYNGDLWSQTQPAGQDCANWGLPSGFSAEGYKVYDCQWPNATSGMFPEEIYHQCWIGNWEGKDAQDCWIHEDLADLNTESAVVQDYLIDTYNKYIDMGVDGFRIDTAVHIPRIMWNRHFLPALQKHATDVHGEKGKDFYVFGEVAQFVHDRWNRGSVNHSAPFYTWDERRAYSEDDVVAAAEQFQYENLMGPDGQPTSTNAVLDGNAYHAPDHSKASGMNIIDMRMHMNFDNASNAFHAGMDSDTVTNDATYNAVYVDSHDYGPGKSQVRFDGGTDAWAENMSLMWTFRGVPVLLYGSEIEFQAGKQIDCGPTCPLATTGRAYYGDHLDGEVVAGDFGEVSSASGEVANTLQQPLVKHLQTLNRIRRAIPALQKGQYSTQGVSGDMAFKRRFTQGAVDSFVLVAVSGGATFSGIPNGTYVDAVTGDKRVVSDGTLAVSLSGKGNLRAYVLSLPGNAAPGKVGDGSPFLKRCPDLIAL